MNQHQAEYLRHLHTERALKRERTAFQAQGIAFEWERIRGRLIATLKGYDPPETSGQQSQQGVGAATTALLSAFPTAVTLKGQQLPSGHWWMVVWLDAPEEEARKREEAHRWLDPLPENDDPAWRCPHDGARCYPKQRLHGVTPKPCDPHACHRLAAGKQLVVPHQGYPLPGFSLRPLPDLTPSEEP